MFKLSSFFLILQCVFLRHKVSVVSFKHGTIAIGPSKDSIISFRSNFSGFFVSLYPPNFPLSATIIPDFSNVPAIFCKKENDKFSSRAIVLIELVMPILFLARVISSVRP